MLPQRGEPMDAAQDARVTTLLLGYFWVAPPRAHPRRPELAGECSWQRRLRRAPLRTHPRRPVSSLFVRVRGGGGSVKLPYAHTRDGRGLRSSSSIPAMRRLSSALLLPVLSVCEVGEDGGVKGSFHMPI
jgi:hypothetical protein